MILGEQEGYWMVLGGSDLTEKVLSVSPDLAGDRVPQICLSLKEFCSPFWRLCLLSSEKVHGCVGLVVPC